MQIRGVLKNVLFQQQIVILQASENEPNLIFLVTACFQCISYFMIIMKI